jgi:hypothetical protein
MRLEDRLTELRPFLLDAWEEAELDGVELCKENDRFALYIDGFGWMTSHDPDIADHLPIADEAEGSIVLTGLGMGMGVLLAECNKSVHQVTVLERDMRVVNLIYPMLRRRLQRVHLTIIICDADEFRGFRFDWAYLDHAKEQVPQETMARFVQGCNCVVTWWDTRQELETKWR